MIIYATYADGFETESGKTNLSNLNDVLETFLPDNSVVHILPIFPSAGDFGFAPNTWSEIREELGNWSVLQTLATKRRILLDGIYNHVGIGHTWMKKFNSSPDKYKGYFHYYENVTEKDGPISPRNTYVLMKHTEKYHLWHSFTSCAVDINLNSKIVISEIDKHLKHLASIGIWGIRLDGIAYYGKELGKDIRHQKGSHLLAEKMRRLVVGNKLNMVAQLDCDEDGLKYYSDLDEHEQVPIIDYMYASFMILSLLNNSPLPLIEHVRRTKTCKRIIVRMPRTHDGILLLSHLLTDDAKNNMLGFAKENNIAVRYNNGKPYELNCSGPYAYSLMTNNENIDAILFIIAVTSMLSGWAYFYLPMVCNFIPEKIGSPDSDARALNRLSIPKFHLDNFIKSDADKVKQLFKILESIHSEYEYALKSDEEIENEMLLLTTTNKCFSLFANFSSKNSLHLQNENLKGVIVFANNYQNGLLKPLGIIILKHNK